MKKQFIITIFTIILIIGMTGTAASTTLPNHLQTNTTTEIHETPDTQDTIQITTMGPLCKAIEYADITFIDGPGLKITLIGRQLTSRYLLLPKIPINVKDLTFSVNYRFNTLNIPLLKRLTYHTTIDDGINETTYNQKHTVIVSGFTGQFKINRLKPIRLTPAQFEFSGTCEDVIIN